tara:strand:+ start:13087 stop:14724 length:1638 start_codon:yes stop_codon:yes gene_type:complete
MKSCLGHFLAEILFNGVKYIMNDILIYKSEAEAGLTDKIRSRNTIAYCCAVQKCELNDEIINNVLSNSSLANVKDRDSLYPTKSVLVSTNWNKNDDVFSIADTWAARHTPVNKPTNIEHDHYQIVGHITNTWAVNNEGQILGDDLLASDLPDLFHLCNGAVIYRYWGDEELTDKVDKLVEEIEANKKFVSMECVFPHFDYAVIAPNADSYTISRNESTAFLTKHLRAYGGEGEYHGYKVGRLLKNMVFSGKGYVDTPANPNSIIFGDDGVDFSFSSAKAENPFEVGVYISNSRVSRIPSEDASTKTKQENNSMSDVDILKNQLDEANKTVADLREKLETLSDKASSANVAKFESQISDLKAQIAKLTDEHKSVTNDLAESSAKVEEFTTQVEELTKVKEEAEAKIQNAEAEKVRTNRVSVLVDGGIDKAEAEETVETFSDLNDKQFEHIANTIVEAKKDKAEDEDDDEKKKKDDEKAKGSDSDDDEANASDDSKILDDAELDGDGAEGASESDDEAEVLAETRASMASYFGTRLGQPVPTENNGE